MTEHNFKPGDVAMIAVGCEANRHRGMFVDDGWRYGDRDMWVANDPAIVTARRLVVIDPEDRMAVANLCDRLTAEAGSLAGRMDMLDRLSASTDRMQAALRSLITPPRPEEPTGLGAVVEEADGSRWVREDSGCWCRRGIEVHWCDVAAVNVLNPGVPS